jgi:polysaccharide export outer membrane protein
MVRAKRLRLLGVLIGSIGWLTACSSAPTSCPTAPSAAELGYGLGPGDRVKVTVFGQTDLSGEFGLDGQGYLALPLVGEIAAGHLSTRELEQAIAGRLREGGFLLNPQVGVQVLTYRPFYILGEVSKPGQYEYKNGMTVVNAVALAGGYTYRAQSSKITIKRAGCTFVANPDTAVLPGEIVTVPERFF